MWLAEQARRHVVVYVVLMGAVVGAIIGLFVPIRAAAPPTADALAWSLPSGTDVSRYDESAYSMLQSATFWNAQGAARGVPRRAQWELRAIMTRPVPQVAVAETGSTQQKWIQVGKTLPDGSTLVAVNRDMIRFSQDGCIRSRRLYSSVTASNGAAGDDAEGCKPASQASPVAQRAPDLRKSIGK